MEGVKKWLTERTAKKNGVYVHYSPPRVVGVVSAAQLRQWARGGQESKLERLVLAGQGRRLLAEAEALPLSHHLPALVAKCDSLHAAVEKGSLLELQDLLEPDYNRSKFVMCRDEAGVGLLHKAVFYDFMDIAEYLVRHYPQLVHMKDSEGRTPLHYAALCRDEACAAGLLEGAGAARGARDAAGHTPAHYRGTARILLALPARTDHAMARENRNPPGLVIKRHNIRIWCHDCDMARLQRVVWDGHGARLLSEVSSQPVVRKFLEAVPYLMNTIRDIHTAVVENDLEGLMKHSGDPVPPLALSSRDANNMTVMHKAAGLGHSSILKYLAERYPQGVNDIDNDGRTPLHYAAAMRDDQHTFNTLVDLGADESILDNKNKTAAFYINRTQDIDKSLFKTLPDAPRTPSSAYPSCWDWKLLDTEVIAELNKKSKRRHFRASNENISSKNNTNTISESTETRTDGVMKTSNTHELIKDLPELDESNKAENGPDAEPEENNETNKESEDVEENSQDEDLKPNDETGENEEATENADEITDNAEETTENAEEATENAEETTDNAEETTENVEETTENVEKTTENPEEITENPEETTENAEETEENLQETPNDIVEEEVDNQEDIGDDKITTEEAIENATNDGAETEDTKESTNEHEDIGDGNEESVEEHETHDGQTDVEETENENIVNKSDSKENEIDENQSNEVEEHTKEIFTAENENDEETNNHDEDYHKSTHNEAEINDNGNGEGHYSAKHEGNNNTGDNSEDDNDVQIPGDAQSEYSDTNLKSTAEISSMGSANLGSESNGRYTQESLIEGIVNGQAEQDSQDASITHRDESVHGEVLVLDNEIDPEVTDLINTANMEMLATLVLNGEGSRLIGRRSGNSELQGFLDNVASYMQKINMVHQAAREGNIPVMQAALDRRKFAIARDPISPNGATPMHVATVFGKTNVMKYLGSKFPETLSAVDFEGRTALHYAAVLPDNGHYYSLLQQLGANSKDLDDNGRSAEDYRRNQSLLPFDQLLSDFGINDEAAQAMFSDKGPVDPDTGHMDIPIFRTEQGRYLAESLGDPLIKGLTEVANVKPKDPVAFLASFLHNFPEHEKPHIGTQESSVVITQEAPEVENEQAPSRMPVESVPKLPRSAARTATRPHKPIDVVTLDPQPLISPDGPETAFSSAKRDEHGQSMLHFAAARTHSRNALFQLLQESDVSIGYRDELYRTARDVSTQANVPENTEEIDRYVLHLAARGNTEKLAELLMEGYDHILDVVDEDGATITDVITERADAEMIKMLASIPPFEEKRDILHSAVRRGDLSAVEEALASEGGRKLICCQNSFSRTTLHMAVLAQHEDIVAYLAQNVPELLRIGDNLERTPLHYAMGVEKIESISRVLIRAGAKRVLKDLKGRQPSYYFMNKSEILRLQEEEEIY